MVWDKDKPAGTQKIRLSDEEIRANNSALEDAIGRNHNFPGTESTTAGQHQIVEIEDNAADPSAEASMGKLYNDGDVLKWRESTSTSDIMRLETRHLILSKSTAYTAVLADFAKLLSVTGTTTITLTAAATLGDGWYIFIKNNGAAVVTIDGNASETIDGATTITLDNADDVVCLVCDGSNFNIISSTLGKPTISDFSNGTHDHSDNANGGLISGSDLVPYIRLHDSKATTTSGGTFTSGAWQKRTVTEDQDTDNNASVSASVITLQAGTYDCNITLPAHRVANHQGRLRNTSDGVTEVLGMNSESENVGGREDGTSVSIIRGRFTIASSKDFEIQHRCQVTGSYGLSTNFGENEIYLVAEFWKVA
jgi:hypothetical protein